MFAFFKMLNISSTHTMKYVFPFCIKCIYINNTETSEYKRYSESRESAQYVTNRFCTSLSIWYWNVLVQYSHCSHGPGSTIDDPSRKESTLLLVLLKRFATTLPLFKNVSLYLITQIICSCLDTVCLNDKLLKCRVALEWFLHISSFATAHSDRQSFSQSLNYRYWE